MSKFDNTNANYEELKEKIFELNFKIKDQEKNIGELNNNIIVLEKEEDEIKNLINSKRIELELIMKNNIDLQNTLEESNKNLEHIDLAILSLSSILNKY
jgi:chromosome segregation ATPase|tara:strand:- start:1149 stop:1445 length:297 start_codon:yes stop_codon:yes gene_type:complete